MAGRISRKVPDEVQKVFDRYTVNFVRRLNKETATKMFREEFNLAECRAEIMFDMFDLDHNQYLSAWEFYLFYQTFGYNANEYLDAFSKLEEGGKGTADIEGTWDFLKNLKKLSGNSPTDEELETSIKGMAGEDRSIDQRKFCDLISRIKLMRN